MNQIGSTESASLHNRALAALEKSNAIALERASELLEDKRPHNEKFQDFLKLKHQVPFFGLVPCSAEGLDFVLFHANDDIVAWEYFWFGADAYEPEIVRTWIGWCRQKNVVLDIGGYTGLMSVLAAVAHPETSICMFEPIERTIERAKINFKANMVLDRVRLFNVAASDDNGSETIFMPRNENFLGTGNSLIDKGKTVSEKQIACAKVDSLLPDVVPTLVKIDVEGHELACLRGMESLFSRAKPRMIIEVWEHSRDEVLDLLACYGYSCKPFEAQKQRVMNFCCVPADELKAV